MKQLYRLLLTSLLLLTGCVPIENPQKEEFVSAKSPADRMLPALENGESVVSHKAYSLVYSEADEQPRWVAYMLTRERSYGEAPRTNNFREDEDIATGSATLDDYRRSGYTRGHLAPAGDMKWDSEAMDETFLLSNMSPQLADFNDGVWNRVEQQVRSWARKFDTLYVVTGPVLTDKGLDQIGSNGVTVPERFYKAIYCPAYQQMIAFLVPHRDSEASLKTFYLTVDELEKITGIDFFPELSDDIEEQMESQICTSCWKKK